MDVIGTDNGPACTKCQGTVWTYAPSNVGGYIGTCRGCLAVEGAFAGPESFAVVLRKAHEAFRRECESLTYWTLHIGWQEHGRTAWHPTEQTGPFSVLTSGCFRTRDEACVWASRNLGPGNWEAKHVVFSPHPDERDEAVGASK